MLGSIEHQRHRVSRLWGQGPESCLRRLPQCGFGVPALHQEEVSEAGPVVLGLQITVSGGHMMSAPGEGHHQDQQAERLEMIPMNVVVQGTKELVKRAGHAYDPKHKAMLPEPMVNGR